MGNPKETTDIYDEDFAMYLQIANTGGVFEGTFKTKKVTSVKPLSFSPLLGYIVKDIFVGVVI